MNLGIHLAVFNAGNYFVTEIDQQLDQMDKEINSLKGTVFSLKKCVITTKRRNKALRQKKIFLKKRVSTLNTIVMSLSGEGDEFFE